MKHDADKLNEEIRKLREQEKFLEEEKRRFITLADNLPGIVYRCRYDDEYTMEFISNAVTGLTGYTPEDLTGNHTISWSELILEEDRPLVSEHISVAVEKKQKFKIQYRIRNRQGDTLWLWEQGSAVFDDDGNVLALEGFITDISDRMASEKALEESEQNYRDLYENAPVAYFSVSSEGKITRCNKKATVLLGYTKEQLRGKAFKELYMIQPKFEDEKSKMPGSPSSKGGIKDYEILMKKSDGSPVWVSMTFNTVKNLEGELVENRVLVLRIESRKKAEEELQVAHKRLSLATKSADIGIWDLDLETNNAIWDNRMMEIYGLEDHPGITLSYDQWLNKLHPEDREETEIAFRKALAEMDTFHARFRIIRPGGTLRFIQAHGMVQTDHNGKAIRMIGINMDETDRKQNEDHILKLNRLYTVLSNVNQSIIRTRDLHQLFPDICNIAVSDGRFDLAWIGLLDKDVPGITVDAFAGTDTELIDTIRTKIGEGHYLKGPTGRSIETKKPVIIRDISNPENWVNELKILKTSKYRAMASFPLIAKGTIRGVFNLYSTDTELFGEDEIKLLNELSGDISYAIEFRDKEEEGLKYQEKLLEATSALHAIIDASPLAIVHLSPEGNVRLWNHAAERIFGWTAGEATGKFMPIVQDDKKEEFKGILDRVLSGHTYTSAELLRRRKDGSTIFVNLSTAAIYDENGEVNGIIEVLEDISQRRIAAEKLKDSEARYRYLFQSNPHPMIVYDAKSLKILEVNDAAVVKYGYSRKEFRTLTVIDIRPEEEKAKFLDMMSHERKSPIRNAGTWKHQLKNGTVIDVDITSHTLDYEGHNAVLVLARDVTERKKWEADLIRAKEDAEQSNRLKDAFVANISHEIRTPLNSILGFSELVRDYLSEEIDGELEKYFDNITKSSHRLMRTVDMILNFSRLQVGAFNIHPHVLDLPVLIEQIVNEHEISAKNKGLSVSFENKTTNAKIKADEYCIMQAVANLIDNAVKYTNEGSVKLTLYREENENISLAISDTGIGMSEEFFDRLFQPYTQEDVGYTRNYEGIGLGLSMVKRYLELNGATISVNSKRNEGTTFTIHFNQADAMEEGERAEDRESDKDETHPSPDKRTKKEVLVVEDDPFSQEYMETILDDKFRVLIAEGAEGAMQILSKNKISLILMDISLKGEMDGLMLTEKLKNDPGYKSIPVIALTAHAFADDRKRSLEAGCDDYFSKPFNQSELIKRMNELLDTRSIIHSEN